MRANYLLIDFENVQPQCLARLHGHSFKVFVFLGANQTKIPTDLAITLQGFGKDAQYIQIAESGRNALDFHIAFTLGELSKTDQNASYYILSKDSGFDPLVKYLKAKGLRAHRAKEIADLPRLRVTNGKTTSEKVDAIVNNLKLRGTSRPRKVGTLKNTIHSHFSESLQDSEVAEIIKSLTQKGFIKIEGETVSYQLKKHSGGTAKATP